MWIIYAITLVNELVSRSAIVSDQLRIYIGPFPINIMDSLLYGGLIACFLPRARRYIGTQMNPAAIWAICLFTLAFIGASIGASINGAATRDIINTARNLTAIPICLFVGTRLVPNLKAFKYYIYVQSIGAAIMSILILVFFRDLARELDSSNVINIRVIAFASGYAGIAAAFLLYTLGADLKIFPTWITLVLIALCTVGQCATLSRSDWLSCTVAFGTAFSLMPKKRAVPILLTLSTSALVVVVGIWLAIVGAAKLTGSDVYGALQTRIASLLPGEHEGVHQHAWDSRTEGTKIELGLFAHSPLIGGGFGIQDVIKMNDPEHAADGLRHDSWTSTLAESGLLGFSAIALVAASMFFVGRRLIRARLSKETMLFGALAVISAAHLSAIGVMTMAFNDMHGAVLFGLTCGLVLRARQLQKAVTEVYGLNEDPIATEDDCQPQLDDAAVAEGELAHVAGIVEPEMDSDGEFEAYRHPA